MSFAKITDRDIKHAKNDEIRKYLYSKKYPLHYAYENDHIDIVQYFNKECKCDDIIQRII